MHAPRLRKYLERIGVTQWNDLNGSSLEEFRELLQENLQPNTVRELCAQLKTTIRRYEGAAALPEGWEAVLTAQREHPARPYLTAGEISRLAQLTPDDPTDKKVLYQFLVQCRTGASLSDTMRLTETNIVKENKATYLVYTNTATKNAAKVRIGRQTLEWLRHLWDFPEDSASYQDTYRTHRRIVKMLRAASIYAPTAVPVPGTNKTKVVPKWQAVNHRTARVSFCTNLFNARVDIFAIGDMIGIKNLDKILHYISVREARLSPAARMYLGL